MNINHFWKWVQNIQALAYKGIEYDILNGDTVQETYFE